MNEESVKVFVAKVPKIIEFESIYPESRWNEIINCNSEKVKKQKYAVWQLLKFVLENNYNLKFEDIIFSKSLNGKWLADKLYFSLSHAGDFVAVCAYNQPIGLDIEIIDEQRMTKKLFEKIATEKERVKYTNPSVLDIAELWTKKEAIFKYLDKGGFISSKIETENYLTSSIVSDKYNIAVSVCGMVNPLEIVLANIW